VASRGAFGFVLALTAFSITVGAQERTKGGASRTPFSASLAMCQDLSGHRHLRLGAVHPHRVAHAPGRDDRPRQRRITPTQTSPFHPLSPTDHIAIRPKTLNTSGCCTWRAGTFCASGTKARLNPSPTLA